MLEAARTELWFAWAEIAIDRELESRRGRRSAERAIATGTDPSGGIELETKAAMSTVVAACAAIETIAYNLVRFATNPIRASRAHQRALRTIARVFPNARLDPLHKDIKWLFELRNATVHYRADWQALDIHPALGYVGRPNLHDGNRDAVRRHSD